MIVTKKTHTRIIKSKYYFKIKLKKKNLIIIIGENKFNEN